MNKNSSIEDLPIPITKKAYEKLKEYNELINYNGESPIRLGTKKEGAHLKKIMGFDEKRFTDQKYTHQGLHFVIDRRELKNIEGYRLDFKETSAQKGFIFRKVKSKN